MDHIAQFVAVLACTFFTGAAVYISFVEHPARLACPTECALAQWIPSYRRAAVMQAGLAVLATIAGLVAWRLAGGVGWLWGTLLIFTVVPFTVLGIMPTNRRLLDPARDRGSSATRELLVRWGRLHAVRSVASLVASAMFLSLLLRTGGP